MLIPPARDARLRAAPSRALKDPAGIEGAPGSEARGLGLLPVDTVFVPKKNTYQSRMRSDSGETLGGYEIHSGESRLLEGAEPFGMIVSRGNEQVELQDGAKSKEGQVWGTYLHGLFHNVSFRRSWLGKLGWPSKASDIGLHAEADDYDRLADVVEEAVSWERIKKTIGLD